MLLMSKLFFLIIVLCFAVLVHATTKFAYYYWCPYCIPPQSSVCLLMLFSPIAADMFLNKIYAILIFSSNGKYFISFHLVILHILYFSFTLSSW